jgi:hypothetical protein
MTMPYIKDSDGKPSLSATLVLVTFGATLTAYLLSIVEHIGPVSIRPFDVAACSSFFIPVLTLYFGRRATSASVTKAMIAAPEPAEKSIP